MPGGPVWADRHAPRASRGRRAPGGHGGLHRDPRAVREGDDRDLPDAAPARAPTRELSRAQPIAASISSTPVLTQLNDGTSRTVWVEASLSRISCTRSRKSLTESLSKATTNSWSSSPKEHAVSTFTDG